MYEVNNDGIYVNIHDDIWKLVMPKEMFIEAFNKYIKPTLITKQDINEWERRLP